jgi:hypothetical protein
VDVGALTAAEIGTALAAGLAVAQDCISKNLIQAAALHLGGLTVQTGLPLLQQAVAA